MLVTTSSTDFVFETTWQLLALWLTDEPPILLEENQKLWTAFRLCSIIIQYLYKDMYNLPRDWKYNIIWKIFTVTWSIKGHLSRQHTVCATLKHTTQTRSCIHSKHSEFNTCFDKRTRHEDEQGKWVCDRGKIGHLEKIQGRRAAAYTMVGFSLLSLGDIEQWF